MRSGSDSNESPAVAAVPDLEEDSEYPVEEAFDDRGNVWQQNRYDLIRSLQRAGRREGFEFVSLKWFRDLFLPAEQYAWSDSLEARSREIGDAIDDGAILTYKVPNTRSPEFPVTAIRLNHDHPGRHSSNRRGAAQTSRFSAGRDSRSSSFRRR